MKPKVSILIATYNRKEAFLGALQSMMDLDYPNFEVVIADNASTDGLPEDVEKKFMSKYDNIILIRNKENLGINGGRSAVQKKATGKYYLFMDSDVYVKKDMLSQAVDYFESNPDVGVIIPKLYFWEDKNRIWCAGTRLNLLTSIPLNVGTEEIDRGQHDKITKSTHGPGAFFSRADVTDKVGGHDKKFFLCYADTDLAFKIKEQGYKVIYLPKTAAYHDIKQNEIRSKLSYYGFDNPARTYYYARNRFIFMKLHAPPLNLLIFSIFISPIFLTYFSFHIIRLKGYSLLPVYWKGFFDGFKYLLTDKWENYS
ncbi:glycosyltransferase [Candidatus Woesearchaeota archaeon]|nr:glycosyltransferase [Candidatus Woesearchaeota archaeon]